MYLHHREEPTVKEILAKPSCCHCAFCYDDGESGLDVSFSYSLPSCMKFDEKCEDPKFPYERAPHCFQIDFWLTEFVEKLIEAENDKDKEAALLVQYRKKYGIWNRKRRKKTARKRRMQVGGRR